MRSCRGPAQEIPGNPTIAVRHAPDVEEYLRRNKVPPATSTHPSAGRSGGEQHMRGGSGQQANGAGHGSGSPPVMTQPPQMWQLRMRFRKGQRMQMTSTLTQTTEFYFHHERRSHTSQTISAHLAGTHPLAGPSSHVPACVPTCVPAPSPGLVVRCHRCIFVRSQTRVSHRGASLTPEIGVGLRRTPALHAARH